MPKGTHIIQHRNGSTLIDSITSPNDIIMHQKNMGVVDCGDQHRDIGTVFASDIHLKNGTEKLS